MLNLRPRNRRAPRQALLHSSALQRVRRVARLRRKPGVRLARPISSRRQLALALTSVALLVLLVLGVFIGRRYTQQKLNVESSIRAQLIPALEKQLGKKVEVGRIESDYASRLVLHDVVIGRDSASPLGALFQAKTVTLHLSVVNLLLHQSEPLQAVSRVVLDAPQLDLQRDDKGLFNLSTLFKKRAGSSAKWDGAVEANNARIYYRDRFVHSAHGRVLEVDAQDVQAYATFDRANPVRYSAFAARAILPRESVSIPNVRAAGTAASNGAWLALEAAWPRASAKVLCEYAFRRGEFVASSGMAGGKINVMWERALPRAAQFSVGGRLVLSGVSGFAQTLKEPGTTRPLLLQNVSGALRFSDKAFQTSGLSLVALSTPLRADGSFTFLPHPIFDVNLVSNSFPTMRALEMLRRASSANSSGSKELAATLQQLRLETGSARGTVRVAGETKNWTARGRLALPAIAISGAKLGAWRASTLSTNFALQNENGRFAIKSFFDAGNARGAAPQMGAWQSEGALRGHLQWTNTKTPAPLQVQFSVPAASGQQTQIGSWRGQNVSGLLSTVAAPNAPVALQIKVEKLAGRHPRWGVLGARNLNATVNTRGTYFAADATAQNATGSNRQLGAAGSGPVQIAVSGTLQNGSASMRAQNLRARNAKFGAAQFANLTGRARWNGARVLASWNARGAQVQTAQAGSWRAASVLGTTQLRSTRDATPVFLDVEARRFYGSHARFGFLKGAALRARASTPDAMHGAWSGVAALGDADLARANLKAVSPALGKQVQRIGAVTGKFRFSGLMGKTPVVKGRARLSRAVVTQGNQRFALSGIETLVAFDGDTARLSNLSAQSDYGILRADISADLKRGGAAFSIVAPNVVLTSAQINEYLIPAGLRVSGAPRARLRISAGSAALARNASAKTSQQVRAGFEIVLPQGRVQWANLAGGAATAVRTQDAHLSGDGSLLFSDGDNWRFAGTLNLQASHAAGENPLGQMGQDSPNPNLSSLARAAGLQVAARGTLARTPQGFAPQFAGEMRAANLVVPLNNEAASTPLALQEVRAEFLAAADSWQMPRFAARAGGDSKLIGHASLRRASTSRLDFSGQALLEKYDAANAQSWLEVLQGNNRNDDARIPKLTGTLFARADFSGALAPSAGGTWQLKDTEVAVQTRLYNGAARWASTPGAVLDAMPLDAARAAFTVQLPLRTNQPFTLDTFSIWSEGGRLGARGTITPTDGTMALDLEANLHALRLGRLARLPSLKPALQQAGADAVLDGLLGGNFHIRGTLAAPVLEGRAEVRLAQAFGVSVESAAGDVRVEPQVFTLPSGASENTLRLAVTNLEGRSRGAAFHGELVADGAANQWHFNVKTDEVSSNRLLLAAGALNDAPANATASLWRTLPLSGALRADIAVSGTLRAEDGSTRIAPRSGTVEIESGILRWRGRDLGTFVADMQLQNGALQARRFELRHVAQKTTTEKTTLEAAPNSDDSWLRLEGVLPVSLDAPALDAHLQVQNERLSFAVEVLQEIREALQQNKQNVGYLDAILARIQSLPPTLDGRLDLDAQIEQSWHAPVIAVRSLNVREVSFRTPSGATRALPSLLARFVYDGNDNGAIAVQEAELRLPAARSTGGSSPSSSLKNDGGDDDEKEDLLIRTLRPGRIVPDGELALSAEILNADLEQLAQWLPGLRDEGGAPAVKGRLSDFVIQLAGTTSAPRLTGSLVGEDWSYRKYSLDRVRLDRFSIADGALRVEPGFLTVVKGDFQSAAAWGRVPWSWGDARTALGLVSDAPLEVHFPIEQENFGALAGIFVPSLQNVKAEGFDGEVTLAGTLDAPRWAGEARITNGEFRFRGGLSELDAGVSGLNGTLKFEDGNRLQIGEEGLRGKLVSFGDVRAPSTGNPETDARRERDERKERAQHSTAPPQLAGDFVLRGNAGLELDPRTLLQARAGLAANRYDLQFLLTGGAYSTADIAGARNVQLAAIWKTGEGTPQNAQHVRWTLTANGGEDSKGGKNAKNGTLVSYGALRLAPNFAQSVDALGRAQAEPFSGADDFRALLAAASTAPSAVAATPALLATLQSADNQDGRIELHGFRFSWKNVARGSLDGTLLLDNRSSKPPPLPIPADVPPRPSASVQPAAGKSSDRARVQMIQSDMEDDDEYSGAGRTRGGEAGGEAGEAGGEAGGESVRLVGSVTLEEAELYGAPQNAEDSGRGGSTGTGEIAALPLPDAPRFDIKIKAGRNVQFISSNLRATIIGDLEAAGTPREPILFGTVFTRGGQITFPNARARLVSGELNIAARRDPITGAMRLRVEIDATAKGRSGRYEITLRLRGPLDTGEASTQDLRVDVSSNPPLSSDEAFSQLLGTSLLNRSNVESTSNNRDNQTYARALVGFLSGPLFSGLEHSLEKVLGLDSIALDYRVDEPIGIEIGKAIGDRFYISYRRALQATAGQKMAFDLRIEYRIKGDLELGLETNELGEKRLSIQKRWRF
jgi:uncharacterized protein YneF (UPF0154 family)